MSRIRDAAAIEEGLKARLEPGEAYSGWAHALQMPALGRVLLVSVAVGASAATLGVLLELSGTEVRGAFIGGLVTASALVAMSAMMRDYAVALTDRRLLAVRILSGRALGEEVPQVLLEWLPPAVSRERKLSLHLAFASDGHRRRWVFPARTIPGNLERARRIAKAFPPASA